MTTNTELQAALEVVRENIQQEMRNMEAVNVGSNYRTKKEIINWVSQTAVETRDFIVYGLSLIEFINQGGTIEQFIDSQLDFIAQFDQSGYDKRSKAHWTKMLYKLYPELVKKIEEAA